jgi:hypothetical protein
VALYRIPVEVGRRVLDHYPGDTFEADLDEIHEWRLMAAGAIERVWHAAKHDAAGGAADTNKHEEQEQ